ncbi:MAG: class I SAM-dependent methyltransferase [Candidatus Micrarchaeota archaeon]
MTYAICGSEWKSFDRIYEKARERAVIGSVKGKSVLDLGCGEGHILAKVVEATGAEGMGIDTLPRYVARCRENFPGIAFRRGDILNLEKAAIGNFDTVMMLEVIEHMEQPELYIKSAYDIAKKRVIITVPNLNRTDFTWSSAKEYEGHIQIFTANRLERMMKRLGIRNFKITPVGRYRPQFKGKWINRIVGRLLRYLNLDEMFLDEPASFNDCYTLMAVIDKR